MVCRRPANSWRNPASLHHLQLSTSSQRHTNMCVVSNELGVAASSTATLAVVVRLRIGVALDAPGFTWAMGGSAPWIAQTTNTFDGLHAVIVRLLPDGGFAWLETTVVGPGILEWAWATDDRYFQGPTLSINVGTQNLWQGLVLEPRESVHRARY